MHPGLSSSELDTRATKIVSTTAIEVADKVRISLDSGYRRVWPSCIRARTFGLAGVSDSKTRTYGIWTACTLRAEVIDHRQNYTP